MKLGKFSHQFSVAITVETHLEHPENIPPHVLLAELLRRAAEIAEEGENTEAFQHEDTAAI